MQTYHEINFGIKSDVGRVRKNNEDYTTFYIPTDPEELKKNGSLFIVADGVGGAAKGEVASRYAADAVLYEYYNSNDLKPAERLARAMQKASHEIFLHSQEHGNFMRMATTMVAALVLQNNLIIAHVGDSRLYLMREGKIKQLTRDHSVVAEMVRNGAMTEEEARTSKAKNRLTRSIGGEAEVHVEISGPFPLNLGDRILICSDGLTRYLDGEGLLAAAQKGEVDALAKDLVKYANEHGGADNVSVILLEMVPKAKSRMKKPVQRQVPPEKLGWDEMETQYPTEPPQKPPRKIPLWALVAGLGILLVIATFLIFGSKEGSEPEDELTPSVQPTGTNTVQTTPSLTNTPTVTSTVGENTQEPTEETPTAEFSGTDETFTSENVTHVTECIYQIDTDDKIGIILGDFGETYSEGNEYWKYEQCELSNSEDDRYDTCDGKSKIGDPVRFLPVGKYLIVFQVQQGEDETIVQQKMQTCIGNGGKILLIEE